MKSKLTIQNFFFILASIALVIFILAIGRYFLVPFLIAVVVSYLIINLQKLFKIKVKNIEVPNWLALMMAIFTCIFCFYLISLIVDANLNALNSELPEYEMKFIDMTEKFLDKYQPSYSGEAKAFLQENLFSKINLRDVLGTLGGVASQMGWVILYVLFLLVEYKNFDKKLHRVTETKSKYNQTRSVLNNITTDLNSYFKIKAIASWITCLLSYAVLFYFGVDFAAFWALLIFFLNFIPTVGSLIATIFPIFIALVQFEGGMEFVFLTVFLILIQIIIGSILEPRYQGVTLNISPLVIVLSLSFWAGVWGPAGALLCIPIMATLNIVLSKFDSTQWISALMSADGKGKGKIKAKFQEYFSK